MPAKSAKKKAGFSHPFNPGVWLSRHAQVLFSSLGRLWLRPLGSLMTLLVLGVAIALPLGLHLLVNNLQQLSSQWNSGASISVFLIENIDPQKIQPLIEQLQAQPDVRQVQHITPQQAMQEFRQHSGMASAMDMLDGNPLPHVLQIFPQDSRLSADKLQQYLNRLEKRPEIDLAMADLQWVERFQGITRIIQRVALVMAVLLSLAVLLIIGNTIRLEIQGRKDEIEIIKLVGGSDAFVRRPFLYEGFWYGLLGSLIAVALIFIAALALQTPIAHLAGLYQSDFRLSGLTLSTLLYVLGISIFLGIFGAWIAVHQQLSETQPE